MRRKVEPAQTRVWPEDRMTWIRMDILDEGQKRQCVGKGHFKTM